MKSEIEVVGEMLFATYYSKDPEERAKITEGWNGKFLMIIKDQGTLVVELKDGDIHVQALQEGEGVPEVDFQIEADVETFTKFTVYSSYGKKDWFKRVGNILLRRIKYKPFWKMRDVIRIARMMGV
ncbi:MAG: hypothetical protein ACTSRS_06580 [Candidatus Helarchaeota archaeon]